MNGSDLGGIYNLNNQKGTKIIGNYVHDFKSTDNGYNPGESPAFGIYLDEGTNHLHVAYNQVAYAGEAGRLIHYNVTGKENDIHDNKGLLCFDKLFLNKFLISYFLLISKL